MTEFEKKLRAMRLSGDTEHIPEGFPTFNQLDELSQKVLTSRIKTKAFEEASQDDIALCVVAEMAEKYDMAPIDQVYLHECIKGLMGIAKMEAAEEEILVGIGKCLKLGISKMKINQFVSSALFGDN